MKRYCGTFQSTETAIFYQKMGTFTKDRSRKLRFLNTVSEPSSLLLKKTKPDLSSSN